MNMLMALCVGAGGGLGALLRWRIGLWVVACYPGAGLPLGTLAVNISGAFLIGLLGAGLNALFAQPSGDYWHAALITGFLGGYTTFSTLMLETLGFVSTEKPRLGWGYALGSTLAGLLAGALGLWLGGL